MKKYQQECEIINYEDLRRSFPETLCILKKKILMRRQNAKKGITFILNIDYNLYKSYNVATVTVFYVHA